MQPSLARRPSPPYARRRGCARPNSRISSLRRSSTTSAAPAAPRRRDRPAPRAACGNAATAHRNRWPACVPGGIADRTGPSSVGTSMRAPSTASCTASGIDTHEIVALAPEAAGAAGLHRHVDIPGRPPFRPACPALGDAQARAIGDARRNRHRQRLRCGPFAHARCTAAHALHAQPPAPVARRTGFREHHVAARPAHGAAPMALRASRFRHSAHVPSPRTRCTGPGASRRSAARRR